MRALWAWARATTLGLSVLACASPLPADPPLTTWTYAPPLLPLVRADWLRPMPPLGRGEAYLTIIPSGISGPSQLGALTATTIWQLNTTLAAIYGQSVSGPALDVVDVATGRWLWRDQGCQGPVVASTQTHLLCGSDRQLRVLDLSGTLAWEAPAGWRATLDQTVLLQDAQGQLTLRAMADGAIRMQATLPSATVLRAACLTPDAALALLLTRDQQTEAWSVDNRGSQRLWTRPGPSQRAQLGEPHCAPTWLLQQGAAWHAVDAPAGTTRATLDTATDVWFSDNQPIVSNAGGVWQYTRNLDTPRIIPLPPGARRLGPAGGRFAIYQLGPELAALVEDHPAPLSAAAGARPEATTGPSAFAWTGGTYAVADHALLLSDGAFAATPRRGLWVASAEPRLYGQAPLPSAPAELRDLPPTQPLPRSATVEVAKHHFTWQGHLSLVAEAPALLYLLATEADTTWLLRANLSTQTLTPLGECGPGAPLALALTAKHVVCATRAHSPEARNLTAAPESTAVSAFPRDATAATPPAWRYWGSYATALYGQGDTVLLTGPQHGTLLDADAGHPLWTFDHELPLGKAVLVGNRQVTYLVSTEGQQLVARLPRSGGMPIWWHPLRGHVSALLPFEAAAGPGVAVHMANGDAYMVALTGHAAPIGALMTNLTRLGEGLLATLTLPDATRELRLRRDGSVAASNDYPWPARRAWPAHPLARHTVRTSDTDALLLDDTGTPERRWQLAQPGTGFVSLMLDSGPALWAITPSPLRLHQVPLPAAQR